MIISVVAESDFDAGALTFVVSLAVAPCTRRYRFLASFHCLFISKTCLAAHLSFIIFVYFSFCVFFRDFYESWWFLSLKVSRSGVEVTVLIFIQVAFFHVWEVVLFLQFTATVFNIRDVIAVDVDQALALVHFVASEDFNSDPFLELWRA